MLKQPRKAIHDASHNVDPGKIYEDVLQAEYIILQGIFTLLHSEGLDSYGLISFPTQAPCYWSSNK